MSVLSDVRHKRLFRKSASEQYRFAKRLSPAQRDVLEQALAAEVRRQPDSAEGRAALTMWMSVQQARLRTHDPAQRRQHDEDQASALELAAFGITLPIVPFVMASQRRAYYRSPVRTEYAQAFDNFMRMLRDPALPGDLRAVVAERLQYHRRSERTIAPRQSALLREHGPMGLAASGYLIATDPDIPALSATDRLVLARRQAAAVRGMAVSAAAALPQASPPSAWTEPLGQAIGALTGTHPDDLDLTGDMTAAQIQAVIDHLHDLGVRDATPRAGAVRAIREAQGNVHEVVSRMRLLVQEGVLSARTSSRAAAARRDTELARARRAAATASASTSGSDSD